MQNVNRTAFRVVLAGLLSGSGFAGTTYWYKLSRPRDSGPNIDRPVARIILAQNEVHRRHRERLIWQSVHSEDILGAGDSIKTGPGSEAQIVFDGTQTVVDIDADSLIVIEEQGDTVALDFIQGSLFVRHDLPAQETNRSDLPTREVTVKSGKSSINDLQGAQVALIKDQKSQNVNVQVFKGNATVAAGGESKRVDKDNHAILGTDGLDINSGSIRVITPIPAQPVYVNTLAPKPVRFRWKPLDGDHKISLEVGISRKMLQIIEPKEIDLERGTLEAYLGFGTSYWRLTATGSQLAETSRPSAHQTPEKNQNSQDSKNKYVMSTPVHKLQVLPQLPPTPLAPPKDQVFYLPNSSRKVPFSWANPAHLGFITIEVSKNRSLSPSVIVQSFGGEETGADIEIAEDGMYFWRLSGTTKDREHVFSGAINSFELKTQRSLPAPKPITPLADQQLTLEHLESSGLFLVWTPVANTQRYFARVTVNGKVFEQQISSNQLRLKQFKPGVYSWQVQAVTEDGTKSPMSDPRGFRIDELKTIQWIAKNSPDIIWYLTAEPQVQISWDLTDGKVRSWRLRLAAEGEDLSFKPWLPSSGKSIELKVPHPGSYSVEVEGLNSDGLVMARSPRRLLQVQALPPPAPPNFAPSLPAKILASRSGRAEITWQAVQGADSYSVQLKTQEGRIVQERKVTGTQSTFTRLMPGIYQISLFAHDTYGRRSPAGESRQLSVPEVNELKAPQIKTLEIK